MRKKLVKHGNSRALIIDKAILELLHADDDTTFEIEMHAQGVLLTPVTNATERASRFETAVRESLEKYGDVYRRLAE
ncbi:MAG: AbrB/MazE/SpoVT family DNA-binding domain-containing protein [Actinobacteria bacterium]|nr:AbrB/MazE/SpoVT family DNA-binding domain-containing protein [Actinomycetota bacterium]